MSVQFGEIARRCEKGSFLAETEVELWLRLPFVIGVPISFIIVRMRKSHASFFLNSSSFTISNNICPSPAICSIWSRSMDNSLIMDCNISFFDLTIVNVIN
eukprot:TRINITY_DN1680_c0_g1_i1.p2 TRINITY_DN1680_c0_g1~~TRINITY_DN1680_c0_g1_i1.p2  ORF type:complete len:101 (+),score=2.99 TRINITY_DN1680_c0_g1_i1:1-303(+)